MTTKGLCRVAFGGAICLLQTIVLALLATTDSVVSPPGILNIGLLAFSLLIFGPLFLKFLLWINEDDDQEAAPNHNKDLDERD